MNKPIQRTPTPSDAPASLHMAYTNPSRNGTMPLLQKGVTFALGRMPKRISPQTHAMLDYAVAGTFLLMAARYWKRNKRAAVGSLACGGVIAINSLLTDYPGGLSQVLSYENHGQIDGALAGFTAAMPRIMGFRNEPEARFFGAQALAGTCITALTDYSYYEGSVPYKDRD